VTSKGEAGTRALSVAMRHENQHRHLKWQKSFALAASIISNAMNCHLFEIVVMKHFASIRRRHDVDNNNIIVNVVDIHQYA